eukprot:11212721-Lingulodinium_polyedra.AAC.1
MGALASPQLSLLSTTVVADLGAPVVPGPMPFGAEVLLVGVQVAEEAPQGPAPFAVSSQRVVLRALPERRVVDGRVP